MEGVCGRDARYRTPPAQIPASTANALGSCFKSDAHALQWIGMTDKRTWQPSFSQPAHSFPCHTMFLASTLQRPRDL